MEFIVGGLRWYESLPPALRMFLDPALVVCSVVLGAIALLMTFKNLYRQF